MRHKESKVDKIPLGEQLHADGSSAFARYKQKAAGDVGLLKLLVYECYNLLAVNLGGAFGYVARKWAARYLFRSVGSGFIGGRGLIVRHPGGITIGDNVAVDDNVFFDAAGSGDIGIQLHDGVILSRNCVVLGKTGHIIFEDGVDVGCNCVFSSIAGITIGSATIIAGNCYIGGGRYYHDRLDQPIRDQGGYSRGPVTVGANGWVGAGAIILDGVTVGKGVIIGAGSVVTGDIPDYSVVAGVPAKVIRFRSEQQL